jgi:hypothetical protein
MEVWDEVICRNEARKEKEAAIISRTKINLQKLISRATVIKNKMKETTSSSPSINCVCW